MQKDLNPLCSLARHADVIIVTGPVTMNMKLALEKSYDAMADPRVVVAAGDGAVTGFPYQGSYALAGSGKVEDTVPVDVNVPETHLTVSTSGRTS